VARPVCWHPPMDHVPNTIDKARRRPRLALFSGIPARGVELDSHTGCFHYRRAIDIVAIKFK
jgi:hypothetical protein